MPGVTSTTTHDLHGRLLELCRDTEITRLDFEQATHMCSAVVLGTRGGHFRDEMVIAVASAAAAIERARKSIREAERAAARSGPEA
jgi:hypothetical protein